MKQLFPYCLAIILSIHSMASAHSTFDGFYFGGTVGVNETDVKRDQFHDIVVLGVGLVEEEEFDTNLDSKGFLGEFFLGYGKSCGCFYLGAEALGNYSNSDYEKKTSSIQFSTTVTNPTNKERQTFEQHWSYGGAVRLGTIICDKLLLFGRAGYMHTEFEYKDLLLETDIEPGVRRHISDFDGKFHRGGLLLGAGSEWAFSNCFSLRFDYTFTHYPKKTLDFTKTFDFGDDNDIDLTLSGRNKLTPNDHRFGIGISYRFNTCCPPCKQNGVFTNTQCFDGFYAGGTIGYTMGGFDLKAKVRNELFAPNVVVIDKDEHFDNSLHGLYGEAFVGYGRSCNCLYMGIEGLAGYTDAEQRDFLKISSGAEGILDDVTTVKDKVTRRETYGGVIRLGAITSENTLLYGRFGYVNTKFDFKRTLSATEEDFRLPTEHEECLNGGLVGFGTEWALSKCLHLRLDYSYCFYETMKHTFTSQDDPGNFTEETKISIKPHHHNIGVSLVLGLF